jgi:glycosidase
MLFACSLCCPEHAPRGEHPGRSPGVDSPDWVKDAVLYCVYLRSFSKEGTFSALEERLPELKSLGVTVLWLMPIHPVGFKQRKGTLGSPYSVRDYYATNPEFGTIVEFQRLLGAVHASGMKLIIDLVANHTSWDSKLITQHPEWFSTDSSGHIVSPNADWTDVADLDYSKPRLRESMITMMEWWIRDNGIDGFRCDKAELVPTDFWEEARQRLDAIKPVMMLAEGSLPEFHRQAFDITYSWEIYDALAPLLSGQKSATLLDSIFRKEASEFPPGALRLRFNTNHDKNAGDAPAVTTYGADGLKLTAVLVNTIPGVPLLYNGEEVANDKKLSLYEKVEIDWTKASDMRELYRSLFTFRKDHKALSRGELRRIPSSDDKSVYAFTRTAQNDRVLVVLNFSPKEISVTLDAGELLGRNQEVQLKELFTGGELTVRKGTPGRLTLAPRGYQIFDVR